MKCLHILLMLAMLSTTAFAQKKFDLYGFMDFKLERYFLPDSSLAGNIGMSEALSYELEHLNVYFDSRPNDRTRALIELNFNALLDQKSTFIERAWVEQRFNQQVNLRLGKFITPVGIWNVDHGSPVITTIAQPYQTSLIPIFPAAQFGVMERGMLFVGDMDVDYKAYITTGRENLTIKKLSEAGYGIDVALNIPSSSALVQQSRVGASGYTGLLRKSSGGVVVAEARELCAGANVQLDIAKALHFQSEYTFQSVLNQLSHSDSISNSWGVYGLLSCKLPQFNPALASMVYGLVEYVDGIGWSRNMKFMPSTLGVESGMGSIPPGEIVDDFITYVAGINFKLFTNTTIKVEYRAINSRMKPGLSQELFDINSLCTQISIAY